ncbi:hypothetical protein [Dokdonella sp.]|uniref:hypothetical protein n=1 Tax=Dokdonella sp. TaxID=2291710 RepID=UPI0035276546
MKSTAAIYTLILTVVAIGAIFLLRDSDDNGPATLQHAKQIEEPAPQEVVAKGDSTPQPIESRIAEPREQGSPPGLYRSFEKSQDLSQTLVELEYRIAAGDSTAMVLAAKALVECALLKVDPLHVETMRQISEIAKQNGLHEIPPRFLAEHEARCGALARSVAPVESAASLMHKALERENPVALAQELTSRSATTSDVEAKSIATRVLETKDPYAIAQLSELMSQDDRMGRFSGTRASKFTWQFVACDLGMDCSSDSYIVRQTCLFYLACGNGGYKDVVRYTMSTPAEFQRILSQEQEILFLIAQGRWAEIFQ